MCMTKLREKWAIGLGFCRIAKAETRAAIIAYLKELN
jgi:hypothetical protein